MSDEHTGAELAAQLQEPFDPELVEFRPQGSLTDKGRGRALAYVDARVVAARLDAVFGPLGWSFTWDALVADSAVRVVRGVLTVGAVSKSDVGDGGDTEPTKAAVSDALKRCAVLLGVGRYLYSLEAEWVEGKPLGKSWVIPDAEVARLRAKLPRPATPHVHRPVPSLVAAARGVPNGSFVHATPETLARIKRAAHAIGMSADDARVRLQPFGVDKYGDLSEAQALVEADTLEAIAADVQRASS